MSLFKHAAGVAEGLGWTDALDQLVEEKVITQEQAERLNEVASENVGNYMMGETVRGKKLENFAFLGQTFEELESIANAAKQGYPNA